MLKTCLMLLAVALTLPTSICMAGFEIEDFSSTQSTTPGITRVSTPGTFVTPGLGLQFANTQPGIFAYAIDAPGQTFGDLDAGFSGGITFSFSAVSDGSTFTISLLDNANNFISTQDLTGGGVTFNDDISGLDEFRISVIGSTAGIATLGGVLVAAVPEPTSLVLVGMGACSMLFRRKRRA